MGSAFDPHFASTEELAAAIRARQISATEALEAQLAQIARHNPALNAVVILDEEGAQRRAWEADAALARGEIWGPLHGVAFTLKDAFAAAGMRSTVGFPPLDHVPREDSTVAARLKAAGGIILGKTNVAALLADFQSANPIFGRTNNPWDVGRTPGGSSGGAAAALAAGMTPFEIGTDLSGSLRLPAHFCGLYGLKPTEHRVSLAGMFPEPRESLRTVRLMSCIGPLARTAGDLALVYGIIAGPDGRDTDVSPVPVGAVPELALKELRIAVAPTVPGLPVAGEIRTAVATLGQALGRLGAAVDEVALPVLDVAQELAGAGELIGMMVGAAQPAGDQPPTTLAQYLAALHRRDRSIRAWGEFFGAWDVLLCPAAMTTAFPHCAPGSPLQVDGRSVDYWMVSAYATLFNYTGHPAIVLPCTPDRDGVPIGVQIVGRRWDESRLLAVAAALAPVIGGFRRPPGY